MAAPRSGPFGSLPGCPIRMERFLVGEGIPDTARAMNVSLETMHRWIDRLRVEIRNDLMTGGR
jgi:DNA-directed RNA polymerase specialized sigma24 family protein